MEGDSLLCALPMTKVEPESVTEGMARTSSRSLCEMVDGGARCGVHDGSGWA